MVLLLLLLPALQWLPVVLVPLLQLLPVLLLRSS
jgi:hypothetical protein